jgi:spore germination protein GerM
VTRAQLAATAAVSALAIAAAWLLFIALPRWYGPEQPANGPAPAPAAPAEARRIKATLYYISEDGLRLVGVERDVSYGESPAEQARRILEEQLKEAPAPLASAVPKGTALRALFLTGTDVYVDFSPEIAAAQRGGSREELFTVYAIVNALATNLPAIARVQILVAGREVDTLAGHVDLRRPLQKNLKWTLQ